MKSSKLEKMIKNVESNKDKLTDMNGQFGLDLEDSYFGRDSLWKSKVPCDFVDGTTRNCAMLIPQNYFVRVVRMIERYVKKYSPTSVVSIENDDYNFFVELNQSVTYLFIKDPKWKPFVFEFSVGKGESENSLRNKIKSALRIARRD